MEFAEKERIDKEAHRLLDSIHAKHDDCIVVHEVMWGVSDLEVAKEMVVLLLAERAKVSN